MDPTTPLGPRVMVQSGTSVWTKPLITVLPLSGVRVAHSTFLCFSKPLEFLRSEEREGRREEKERRKKRGKEERRKNRGEEEREGREEMN